MNESVFTRGRMQAVAMVLIGALVGYAVAASWDRAATAPAASEAGASGPSSSD